MEKEEYEKLFDLLCKFMRERPHENVYVQQYIISLCCDVAAYSEKFNPEN